MKAALLLILVTICVSRSPSQERKQSQKNQNSLHSYALPAPYYRAGQFIQMSEAERLMYTAGLMDGFLASSFFGGNKQMIEGFSTCTQRMEAKQVSAIITKYVKEHPDSWHLPLSISAINALNSNGAVCEAVLSPK